MYSGFPIEDVSKPWKYLMLILFEAYKITPCFKANLFQGMYFSQIRSLVGFSKILYMVWSLKSLSFAKYNKWDFLNYRYWCPSQVTYLKVSEIQFLLIASLEKW